MFGRQGEPSQYNMPAQRLRTEFDTTDAPCKLAVRSPDAHDGRAR